MYNAVMDRSVIEKVSYDLFKYLTSSAIVGLSEEQSSVAFVNENYD